MQTETIFRAARAIATVRNSIEQVWEDRVSFAFGEWDGKFTLVLTGWPDVGPDSQGKVIHKINGYAASLGADSVRLELIAASTYSIEAA